jgi:hypothetical protein
VLLSLVLGATSADSQWIVESYAQFPAALILVGEVLYFLPFLLIQVHGHSATAAGSSFYQPGGEPVPA